MQVTEVLLEIFGKKYKVLNYNIGFYQASDVETGKVTGIPIAENLTLEVVSDGENEFAEWMEDATKTEDGELSFMDGNTLKKSIQFEKAYLVGFRQNFATVQNGHSPKRIITEDLVISFKSMDFGGVKIERAKAA